MGIKDEDKCKLFQMFGRLEEGENMNKHGVGLGLTISNALAKMLNGNDHRRGIQVTSQFKHGSCFSFTILKDLNSSIETNLNQNSLEFQKALDTESDANKAEKDLSNLSISSEAPNTKISNYKTSRKINISDLNTQKNNSHNKQLKANSKEKYNGISKGDCSHLIKNKKSLDSCRIDEEQIRSPREKTFIFIVDDNPFNLLISGNLVKDLGYSLKTAGGGHEVIRLMEEMTKGGLPIKAILMDCQMPVMDGYEASKILIEMMDKGKIVRVPIFALTADDSEETIKKCYESGMKGHIMKPTSKSSLIEVLSKIE